MSEIDPSTTYFIKSVHSGHYVAFFDTGSARVFQQETLPSPPSPLDIATRTFTFFPRPIDLNNPAVGTCYYIASCHTAELATVMFASMDNAGLRRDSDNRILPKQAGSIVPWGYIERGVEFDGHVRFVLEAVPGKNETFLIRNLRSGRYWHIENAEMGTGAYVGQWELPVPPPPWFEFVLQPTGTPVSIGSGADLVPYFLVRDAVLTPAQQLQAVPYYPLSRYTSPAAPGTTFWLLDGSA